MYGLTECTRASYLPPDQIDIRPGSVGRGIPNEEVYLVDHAGHRIGPGLVGELVVRGSNVMQGYWGDPEGTERVLKAGVLPGEKVLHTGDLFRSDDDGYLYFVARQSDMINSRGEKISPVEVENALHNLSDVEEAAVIGVPDAALGEAVHAFVVLRAGSRVTERDVQRQCVGAIEHFMIPKHVEFVDSLPKSANGKIDRRALASAKGQ